jgi:putative DNA primase/helicase
MSMGLRPMWSTGSTAIMSKLPVVAGIESLTVIADRDENGAGEKAAREAAQRWREAGREVRVWTPPEWGDFNDLLMRGVL